MVYSLDRRFLKCITRAVCCYAYAGWYSLGIETEKLSADGKDMIRKQENVLKCSCIETEKLSADDKDMTRKQENVLKWCGHLMQ